MQYFEARNEPLPGETAVNYFPILTLDWRLSIVKVGGRDQDASDKGFLKASMRFNIVTFVPQFIPVAKEVSVKRLRSLFLILGSMVIASLLIACGSAAEATAPTAVPTPVPDPPTSAPASDEVLGPADSKGVPRITPQELKDRLDNGKEILVYDTRGSSSYDYNHIAGALKTLDSFDDYPRDKEIVLYCD